MAIDIANEQGQSGEEPIKQACFLCALDKRPCAVTRLEGRILSAQERRTSGGMLPVISIDTGTSFASLILTPYYRSFMQALVHLGPMLRTSHLTLRVYHLPAPTNTSEHKGRLWQHYMANSYTLAVLEPDTLLNITDLNQAEYCPRQYLLRRLIPSPASAATIRGNFVHHCFKELLKEHDRGELMNGHPEHRQETALETLQRHFTQALERDSIELALSNLSADAMQAEVMPHLESLASWYQNQRTTLWDLASDARDGDEPVEQATGQRNENLVRAETFLLAPEIGLRGRLDLLWQQAGRQRLLELKTGGSKDVSMLPKREHRWQVYGYHALLTVRRDSKMKKALATLLYSGTPGQAQDFGIPFSIRELQRVNETRNILVLSHVTSLPPAPPGPSRCTKCVMLDQCGRVSSLLAWRPPEPEIREVRESTSVVHSGEGGGERMGEPLWSPTPTDDQAFFQKYYRLLQLEGREIEQQQALLWKTSVAERIERGSALSDLVALGPAEPTGKGEWWQTFRCTNTSELREGDEILLSDGDPVTGEVVTGNIVRISAEEITVWSPELIAQPTVIDRYDSAIVHVRTLQNLLRWLQADIHLRGLVAGTLRPRFDGSITTLARADFNPEQNLAVERAVQMGDYLLIHGPPGTGKTSVIAEIVKRLCQQGQRVLLAAFTNQAVDNMLKRLDQEGFHDYLRLGQESRVDERVRPRLLKHIIEFKQHGQDAETEDNMHNGQDATLSSNVLDTLRVRELLRTIPVVASTTATWSSEKHTPQATKEAPTEPPLQFDVALIDEAGQLTIPAILGALRFAKRFILVGDQKQLPPLVISKIAAEAGLSESLFSQLQHLDDGYRKEHPDEISASVPLRTQYRMNKWISHFSSVVFYEGTLKSHANVADRVLPVKAVSGEDLWMAQEASVLRKALQPGLPMVFLDVQSEQERAGFKTSDAEARTVRAVVAGLLARGIVQKDIGIIAPYRAQVANLRRHLLSDDALSGWQALSSDSLMSIDTVDRFQGGERLVIILSFATLKSPEATSPLRDFLTNPNRLNVALTRAQCKLILVGNAAALEELPYLQRLITYCKNMKTLLPFSV